MDFLNPQEVLSTRARSRSRLKSDIQLLGNNPEVFLLDLEESTFSQANTDIGIAKLRRAYHRIKKVDPVKYQVAELILQQYRPLDIYPGTLGGYLFGGIQENFGEVPASCSALYRGSLLESNKEMPCQYQIWIQVKPRGTNRFIQIYDFYHEEEALIYLMSEFRYFRPEEIASFREKGVRNVKLLGTKKSKHYLIRDMAPLDLTMKMIESTHQRSLLLLNEEDHNSKLKENIYHLIAHKPNELLIILGIVVFSIIVIISIMGYLRLHKR